MSALSASGRIRERAHQIAEEVLFPAAIEVDRADRVPASHLDLLASDGFYGLAADDAIDANTIGAVVETLASGSLATAFVWLQHHAPVRAAAEAGRADLLPALAAGKRRAGIGFAGIRSPRDPMRVRRTADGYALSGTVPWVTGWDMIDSVYVAARDENDVIHYLLVDAIRAPSLTPAQQNLVAVQASRTVNVTFNDHRVPADQLIHTQPYQDWLDADAGGSTTNGYLSLGVINRCCQLLGPSPLDDELNAARAALDSADAATTPAARARASALAMRAASILAVTTGARAVLVDQHAQRLVREATFLLVFGSRPAIRTELLNALGSSL